MHYRKKPVVIEAFQVAQHCAWPEWFHEAVTRNEVITQGMGKFAEGPASASIKTLEGVMVANEGDWIVRGVKGELYPCKPDIFAVTYEVAE